MLRWRPAFLIAERIAGRPTRPACSGVGARPGTASESWSARSSNAPSATGQYSRNVLRKTSRQLTTFWQYGRYAISGVAVTGFARFLTQRLFFCEIDHDWVHQGGG